LKNHIKYTLILIVGLLSSKSISNVQGQATNKDKLNYLVEQQQALSYFNIYRGNSHSHTIYTWTHGAHREEGMLDLASPTKFHPDWNVPPGMDWKDYKTISLNPNNYTNRQGLPANHFEMAIKNGYDFYATTDHTQEPNLQPVSVNNPAWQTILKTADTYNHDSVFVALSGFEFSRNTNADGGNGHINVINSSEYVNADYGQRGPALPWPEANWSIPQFYNWIKSARPHGDKGDVLVGFNHPDSVQYNDWDHIDPEIVKLISTFELHTGYGPIRWRAYIRALNKGWMVAPIGVLDNHGFKGRFENLAPPTFVLAPVLTREAIIRSMRQRRTFTSWIEGVELRYAVNGVIMGSILDSPDTFNFHIEVNTRPSHPDERIRRIQILRDHSGGEDEVELAADILFDGDKNEIVWTPVIKDSSARYFLLRIYHAKDMTDDGNFKLDGSTVSAPVWTGR